jgi:hypothetical protein
MANTTFRAFVDALEALVVTGVKKRYTQGPPLSLNSSDLPAQYVRLPSGGDSAGVFQQQGIWRQLQAFIVIVVEAVGQSTGPTNFDDTVDLMDNLSLALEGTTCGQFTKSSITWEIRQSIDTVAGNEYWAVIARVEGRG